MALTLATTMRDAIADAVDARINGGGGAGYLKFQTSADGDIAQFTFETTAFGASNTGVITMASQPKTTGGATAGTLAKFRIFDFGDAELIQGSVSTTGADINFPGGLVIGTDDTLELTTFTITCPAS